MTTILHTRLVFARQLRTALRDIGPAFIAPMMPSLLMVVVFTSVFDGLATLDGFDTSGFTSTSWDAYLTPGAVILVALLGAGYSASSLASDLRTGYCERMALAGIGPGPQIAGRLVFEAVRLVPGVAVVVLVGFAFGQQADNGAIGVALLIVLVPALGVAFTGLFYLVAIRTEDPQTPVQLAPLGLPLAFLSSALVPLTIMPTWSETVSTYNPVRFVVDAARNAMIGDLWSDDLALATVVLAAATIVGAIAASVTLGTKIGNS